MRRHHATEVLWWGYYLLQCITGTHRGCATARICLTQVALHGRRAAQG